MSENEKFVEPKRARRRRDKERMKMKCKRIHPWDKKARTADYLAVCSCTQCGNPRRHFGYRTMQEMRHGYSDRGRNHFDR